jgi:hypothetical protein
MKERVYKFVDDLCEVTMCAAAFLTCFAAWTLMLVGIAIAFNGGCSR